MGSQTRKFGAPARRDRRFPTMPDRCNRPSRSSSLPGFNSASPPPLDEAAVAVTVTVTVPRCRVQVGCRSVALHPQPWIKAAVAANHPPAFNHCHEAALSSKLIASARPPAPLNYDHYDGDVQCFSTKPARRGARSAKAETPLGPAKRQGRWYLN